MTKIYRLKAEEILSLDDQQENDVAKDIYNLRE